jgi:anti-anti-sigma factor
MKLTCEQQGDVILLRAAGKLDAVTAPQFREDLEQTLTPDARRVVLDLSDTSYVSSAGLRVLIVLAKQVMPRGKLAVAGLNESVREVFELAGFDKIMTLCDDVAAALEAV